MPYKWMKNSCRGINTSNPECLGLVSLNLYLSSANYKIIHFCTSPEACASVWAGSTMPMKMWPFESAQWQNSILGTSSSKWSRCSASLFPVDRVLVPRKWEKLELATQLDPTARAQQGWRQAIPPTGPGIQHAPPHHRGQTPLLMGTVSTAPISKRLPWLIEAAGIIFAHPFLLLWWLMFSIKFM